MLKDLDTMQKFLVGAAIGCVVAMLLTTLAFLIHIGVSTYMTLFHPHCF